MPAKGQKNPNAGRPKGALSTRTVVLKEAILLAGEAVGENGKGKDGLMGYLKNLARTQPQSFASLLGKVLPLTIAGDKDNPVTFKEVGARESIAERIAELAARRKTIPSPKQLN